jgi:hypothetical protein
MLKWENKYASYYILSVGDEQLQNRRDTCAIIEDF